MVGMRWVTAAMAKELAWLSATKLLKGYKKCRFSPVEVTEAILERIGSLNHELNAYCHVDAEGALAAARASERRWSKGAPQGRLDGVPVSIKDLILTAGMPTLRGSRTVDPQQAFDVDAPVTARLKENGAIILGKTTTPEFGWKGVTDSPLTGITRNPWDMTRTPGGSSGGGAAAVAAGYGRACHRHRWRRLDPHPGRLHRHFRAEAVLRPRPGLAPRARSAPSPMSAR